MNLITIKNVRGYIEDEKVFLNLEDVARGLGFEKREVKNGKEYRSIRWARIFDYLKNEGFDQTWSKESFIPENAFYSLCMIADSDIAKAFRRKVCDEILPEIRKNGGYLATYEGDTDEEIMARALKIMKTKLDEREQRIVQLESKVEEDKPKVRLVDQILEEGKYFVAEEISKMLNKPGWGRNNLLRFLKDKKFLGENGYPYQKYVDRGYAKVIIKSTNKGTVCVPVFSIKMANALLKYIEKTEEVNKELMQQ